MHVEMSYFSLWVFFFPFRVYCPEVGQPDQIARLGPQDLSDACGQKCVHKGNQKKVYTKVIKGNSIKPN